MSYCYKGSFGALFGYLRVLQGYVGTEVMEYGQLDSGLGDVGGSRLWDWLF